MTTYTRASRISKRDAYLLKKYEGRPSQLVEALKDHEILRPFNPRQASLEELTKRWSFALETYHSVSKDFRQWEDKYFPKLEGTPVSFLFNPEKATVEVILRRNTARPTWSFNGTVTPEPLWEYHSVVLPERILSGNQGFIGGYFRKLIKGNRNSAEAKAQREREAEEKRIQERKNKILSEIRSAHETIRKTNEKLKQLNKERDDLG